MSEDAELMGRVQGGDAAALGTLMERWELPVKGLIGRLVQNRTEAEELAQEAFVRVWQQRARYRPGSEFRSWLFAIAVNLARNRLRWWRRRPSVALEEWDGADPRAEGAGSAGLERRERAAAVRSAVGELPREWREAIVLAEYERMSHAEIAAAVGATPKAVESRLYRARAALRTSLRRWVES